MAPDPSIQERGNTLPESSLQRLLGGMSIFTMTMTLPQVWTVWVDRQTSGVSVWSWGAYFASAILWFVHGVRQGDKNIYLPCIGWMLLDVGLIAGVLMRAH